jgi:hypothetical protein
MCKRHRFVTRNEGVYQPQTVTLKVDEMVRDSITLSTTAGP